METIKKINHNPFLTRVAAIILAVSMMVQIGGSLAIAATSGLLAAVSPIVCFKEAEIYDDMRIDAGGDISVHYIFKAARNDLSGVVEAVSLPKHLRAADGISGVITGFDAKNEPMEIGTWTVNTNSIKVSFYDLLSGAGAVATDGDADSGGEAGNIASDGNTGAAATDPDELITVDFCASATIDLTGLMPNWSGTYTVPLVSGGQQFTVIYTPPSMTNFSNFTLPFGNVAGIYKTEVLKDNKPLTNANTVAASDDIEFRHYYSISPENAEVIYNIVMAGTQMQFEIPVPVGLILTSDSTQPIDMFTTVTLSSGAKIAMKYGNLYIDNGRAYVMFTGEFWTDTAQYYKHGIDDGSIMVACGLNMGAVGANGQIRIEINSTVIVTLNVVDDRVKPKVEKEMVKCENGVFTWKVTYTPGDKTLSEFPIIFTDTFDTSAHIYVDGSLTYTVYTTETAHGAVTTATPGTVDNTSNPGSITYEYDGAGLNATPYSVVFEYKTKLTTAAYATAGTTNVSNTAQVSFPDNSALNPTNIATAGATAPITEKKLLKKGVKGVTPNTSGTYSIDPADHMIEWQVDVYTNGLDITRLTFNDTIPLGLTLDYNSIGVKGGDSKATIVFTGLSSYTGTDSSIATPLANDLNGPATFCFEIPDSVGIYESYYTITYKTKVADSYYNTNTLSDTFRNNAWLDIELTDGPVPSEYATIGPVPVSVNTALLTKSFSGSTSTSTSASSGAYDAKTHTIEWIITVNPHYVNVTGGTITDTIPAGLAFDGNSFSAIATATGGNTVSTSNTPTTVTQDGNGITTLTYDVGNLGNSKLVLKYKTYVTDAFLLGEVGPASTRYTNIASPIEYYRDAVNNVAFSPQVNNAAVIPAVSRTATVHVPVEMLKKSVASNGTYNYKDHSIVWEVRVNQNKVSATSGVTLTDDLKAVHLKYDAVSFSKLNLTVVSVTDRDGNAVACNAADYSASVDSNGILIITLRPGICDEKTAVIQFKTFVDVDANPDFQTKTSFGIRNTIELDGIPNVAAPTSNATVPITNNMVSKNGINNNNKIAYSIDINPHELKLDDCKLTDVLPDELKLDVGSVQLWVAEIDNASTSALTKVSKIDMDTLGWTFNVGDNSFTIPIPDGNNYYILEYECYIIEYVKSVKNDVAFTGTGITNGFQSAASTRITISSDAFTILKTQSLALRIVKEDSMRRGEPVPDITFSLWTDIGGKTAFVEKGETDSKGYLTFYYLSPEKKYWLTEEGYTNGATEIYETGANAYVVEENGQITKTRLTNRPDTSYSFTTGKVGSGNNNVATVITIVNDPKTRDVEFIKVSSNDDNIRPSGAVFALTEVLAQNSPRTNPLTKTAVSGSDGMVKFESLPIATTYTFKEITAPQGYALNDTEYLLEIDDAGNYNISDPSATWIYYSSNPNLWRFKNIPDPTADIINATVQFYKVSSANTALRLPGAKFKIVDNTSLDSREEISDENGLVTFENLTVGREYTLTEMSAPTGYTKDAASYILKVATDGSYTISNQLGVVYNSAEKLPTLYDFKNAYSYVISPSRSSYSFTPSGSTLPGFWPLPIYPPEPHYPGNSITRSNDNLRVYIEVDKDGEPVGEWEWTKNDDGMWEWIFKEYSSTEDLFSSDWMSNANDNPYTGTTSMLPMWFIAFFTAAVAALIFLTRKKRLY